MTDIWFEEELVPAEATIEHTVKSIAENKQASVEEVDKQIRSSARSILRVDKPRWGELKDDSAKLLSSGKPVGFYLVRLGFQFDVPQQIRDQGAHFVYARCSAILWAASAGQPQPTVYEVIPHDLYEGQPRQVKVEIGPGIKLSGVGVSLGKASTDFAVGFVEPVVVGWTGKDEREPYWDLRPKSKALLGVHHLWLVVEVPTGCNAVRLAARVEGDLQAYFGVIPVGPRVREWKSRPSILIE